MDRVLTPDPALFTAGILMAPAENKIPGKPG